MCSTFHSMAVPLEYPLPEYIFNTKSLDVMGQPKRNGQAARGGAWVFKLI